MPASTAYWRAAAAIAAATTTLPGFDALVFTGGIGERSGPIGSRIVRRLAALGLDPLDERERDEDDDGILGFGMLRRSSGSRPARTS